MPLAAGRGSGKNRRGYHWTARRHLADLDPAAEVGREAARRTLRKLGARTVPTCEVPVVFDPDSARSILGLLAGCVMGSSIWRKASHLRTARERARRERSCDDRRRSTDSARPRLAALRRRGARESAKNPRRREGRPPHVSCATATRPASWDAQHGERLPRGRRRRWTEHDELRPPARDGLQRSDRQGHQARPVRHRDDQASEFQRGDPATSRAERPASGSKTAHCLSR